MMKINSSNINNISALYPDVLEKGKNNKTEIQDNSVAFKSELPSTYSVGQSLINSNNPISYNKIAEVEIPGVKNKASVYKLANGQKVVIAPKKGPTYIKTTYNVGSMNETEEIRGISHFIEHNLFNGSKDLAPREYDKKVSDLGGHTNASTSYCATDYYIGLQLINDNSLEEAIKLNAAQTQFPTFPIEQLEKEKEPVKSEIDMYKDKPEFEATSIALKNLLNIQTQSNDFILGTKENINSFTREKVLDYFNTWYTPDNAVTVVTGDVDPEETIRLISKYFNKQNDYSNISKRHYEPIKYTDKPIRADIIRPNATSSNAVMAFAIPEGTSKEELEKITMLVNLLSLPTSQLSKALDKNGLNFDVYIEGIQNKPDGAKAIVGTVEGTEKQIEGAIKTIYENLINIANNPPSQKEVDNLKKAMINNLKASSESSQSINSNLTKIALTNDYGYYANAINLINSTTPSELSEIAKKFFDLNKVSICVSHEKNANQTSVNNNFLSAYNTAPKSVSFGAKANPKEAINEVVNNIRTYKLPNNIETSYTEGTDGARAALFIDYQSDSLNNFSYPAFSVLSEILNRGSIYRNNDAVNQIKTENYIGISFSTNQNGLTVKASFNDENLNIATGLIKETLFNPNFTEEEFNRAKEKIKDSIENQPKSAFDNIDRVLYPDIKAIASKEQMLQELDALSLQDVQNLYMNIMNTSQATASMIAPINEKPYMADILNAELSAMPIVRPFNIQHSEGYNIHKPNTQPKLIVDVEEKTQAEIVQAYTFKETKNIDDIAKINIMELILGGSMSSRLFTDLRENQKLAYHVSSGISGEKDSKAIYLTIGTTTESPDYKEGSPANLTKALEGFERNINLLKTQNVTDKELENAKIKLKSDILNIMETNTDKNLVLTKAQNSPYGKEHYIQLMDAIDRVTADDIRTTANYIFSTPPVTSIVASQKTLDALNLK